jgi:hypothetical protein
VLIDLIAAEAMKEGVDPRDRLSEATPFFERLWCEDDEVETFFANVASLSTSSSTDLFRGPTPSFIPPPTTGSINDIRNRYF